MTSGGPSPQEAWDELFGEFYVRAYGNADDGDTARDEALGAARLAGCDPGAALLDVGCGFARHAIPLARAGYRVTGVDRSEALLAEGRRRAGDDVAPALVRADYRELPFPDESFDGALNLFSSLGYLGDAEDERALAETARVLRPDARLIVESIHRDLVVREYQEQEWHMVGQGRLLLEQRAFEPASGIAQTTQTLVEPSGERESRTFSIRVYAATELVAMLRRAGFGEVKTYGGLDGEPLTTSSRLVLAARK